MIAFAATAHNALKSEKRAIWESHALENDEIGVFFNNFSIWFGRKIVKKDTKWT